jgi:hypothetical protein
MGRIAPEPSPAPPGEFYQIRVQGHLGDRWSDWFEGLTLTAAEGGEMVLSGPIRDQAALYGVLARVRDLGLPLVSVNRLPGYRF